MIFIGFLPGKGAGMTFISDSAVSASAIDYVARAIDSAATGDYVFRRSSVLPVS